VWATSPGPLRFPLGIVLLDLMATTYVAIHLVTIFTYKRIFAFRETMIARTRNITGIFHGITVVGQAKAVFDHHPLNMIA